MAIYNLSGINATITNSTSMADVFTGLSTNMFNLPAIFVLFSTFLIIMGLLKDQDGKTQFMAASFVVALMSVIMYGITSAVTGLQLLPVGIVITCVVLFVSSVAVYVWASY